MLICKFCSRECKNDNSLRNHERLCKSNPDRQIITYKLSKEAVEKIREHRTGRKHSKETIEKIANAAKGRKHTEETKQKIRKGKIDLYNSGWEPTCGRCKKYNYVSPIAGDVKVDGSWELIFCKYMDLMKFSWQRNKKRFDYIRPNGKKSTYQPDFFVKEWNSYVEVKGYETDLDRCKWSQFPEKLIVVRKENIKDMEGELDRV